MSLLQPGCFEPNRGSTVFSRPGRFGKYQRCPPTPPQGLSCWRGKSSWKKGRGKREDWKGKGRGKKGKELKQKGKARGERREEKREK